MGENETGEIADLPQAVSMIVLAVGPDGVPRVYPLFIRPDGELVIPNDPD